MEGATQSQVSQRIGMTRQSVQKWCARFWTDGATGLWDRRRAGRPRQAGEEVESAVRACLGASDLPGTRGPGGWTAPRLIGAMMKRGLAVGARTMRRVLGRLGARWRRGQLVAKGDPDRAAALERLAEALATARMAARRAERRLLVLFEDEADLALLPHAGASWQLPDRPATIPTPGQNHSWGLFGSLGLEG